MRYKAAPCLHCGRDTEHIPGGYVHSDNRQVHCAPGGRMGGTEARPDWKGRRHTVQEPLSFTDTHRRDEGDQLTFYDTLHDMIPSDVPATVWESDAASKGAGE